MEREVRGKREVLVSTSCTGVRRSAMMSCSIKGDCIESWVVAGVLSIILLYYRILYVVLVISLQ